MSNNLEIAHLNKCLALIEAKLNWGASHDWTGYDFEKLSVEIQMATGVLLSTTTLKRLWGKLKYTNMPTTTTLNTLAKFAGYEDWRAFKNKVPLANKLLQPVESFPAIKKTGSKYWLFALFPLFIIGYFVVRSNDRSETTIDTSAYQFSSNKIKTEGVPNSVIFNYDATAATAKDSVFISQSWDIKRKVAVPQQERIYSAIYYQPGYFRAKLMVGNQVIKEHGLMIASGGWLAMVYKEGEVPLYFKKDEVMKNNQIEVNEALLSKYNLPLQPVLPSLSFFNVQDMGDMKNDNFVFETTLKSDFQQGTAACQRVEVLILSKDDSIIIPLSSKGCIGDLSLYAAGTVVESKRADLSRFGCDLNQWVKLRVESKNRHLRFLINGEEAYSLNFSNQPTAIVGLEYRFNGTGAVKNTRLIKDNRILNF